MPVLQLDSENGLYYELDRPNTEKKPTFVFVNAITGDASMWQEKIGPELRKEGYGTLAYNFRGQAKSPYSAGLELKQKVIVSDLMTIVKELDISNSILVGLSIGGLFATNAYLNGLNAKGLILINTLRTMGPRINWMNAGTLRLMEVAGPNLMRDVMTPLIFGPKYLEEHRQDFLLPETKYDPLPTHSGAYNLITWMGSADWEIAYEQLKCPTLVITGLHDRVFYDAKVVDELFRRLPNGKRIDMPDAGHMLPIEFPEKFIDMLQNFGSQT